MMTLEESRRNEIKGLFLSFLLNFHYSQTCFNSTFLGKIFGIKTGGIKTGSTVFITASQMIAFIAIIVTLKHF